VGEFVARRGLATPDRALQVLHALTQRFTAEFAIRPFIVQHPALVFATLQRWTQDPSDHVRRLVSEGSRPRLPWGLQLKALVADPSPTLPLLRALQDDPSEYVRRSVANHLNDIAKDHPALVADWLRTHLPDAPPARRTLLRHASRTLIKAGDRRCWPPGGWTSPSRARPRWRCPAAAAGGRVLRAALSLQSGAARPQKLAVDYAVHHVKADGRLTAKVFKGWTVDLAATGSATWSRPTRCERSPHAATTRAGMRWTCASTAGWWPRPASSCCRPSDAARRGVLAAGVGASSTLAAGR
jgi:3-methyladenine DNA glycosylase AlkC